ncbi:MAG: hypothetical protein NUW22_16060 [Acidobacteria bacterium]|nr:hypothetical protein [Acidobacteriota bacterium]
MSPKSLAWVSLVVVVAALSGWMYGASGRSALEQARRASEQRADLMEARALILDGQVQVFLVNFGVASQRYEAARAVIERMQTALREIGQAEPAGRLEIPLSHLRDAQRLASSLDGAARNAADEALRALQGGDAAMVK